MQERGLSKAEACVETGYGADRDYGVGAQILHELGLRRILLLTNHPPKVSALEGFELEIVGSVALGSPARALRNRGGGFEIREAKPLETLDENLTPRRPK